jgi:F0F1-type ATP synthase membrane subunit b/b'
MLPLDLQWLIIFGSITFLIFLYLLLDWVVIDNLLDKRDKKLEEINS